MSVNYQKIREEELKNKVSEDYFFQFDTTRIIGNIDFCVSLGEEQSLLWAEAKKNKSNLNHSLVQLILTIGKARTFDQALPPAFLGAFDAYQIAFIPYNQIQEIFYQSDFNWNVTPSNQQSPEFKKLFDLVEETLFENSLIFKFESDSRDLQKFIEANFRADPIEFSKIKIDKNNFLAIYNKWLLNVKPSIILDWERAKENGIIDGDFYLADLLSSENQTLKEKLWVLLKKNRYELDRKLDEMGFLGSKTTNFNDNQKAHLQFWNKYERPPKEEYWDYIVERRDLLVPQDIRERKGSFFTPQVWVEKSQEHLAKVLDEDWQDHYYIWDCAAGTGNLLAGLTNKYKIYASTIDQQDVDVIKDRIKNGANLLESHVFQFDFLNDQFNETKVPKSLQEILQDPEKRKKLVIYINPPYAEAGVTRQRFGTGKNKAGVAIESLIFQKYSQILGKSFNELFSQFLFRIYEEIPNCVIGQFSTLKALSGANFRNFRNNFLAKLESCFLIPANTFDNVKGQFPIGFMVWDTSKKEKFKEIEADVYQLKSPPSPLERGSLKSKYDAKIEALHESKVFKYNLDLLPLAKKLREDPTEAEKVIWDQLLRNKQTGYKFTRQKPIGNFILGFYCSELLLGIEVDGEYHLKQEDYDQMRTELLNNFGIKIIRYTNKQVLLSLETVRKELEKEIKKAKLPLSRGLGGDLQAIRTGTKKVYSYDGIDLLSGFTKEFEEEEEALIAHFAARGNDFQNQTAVFIESIKEKQTGGGIHVMVKRSNLIRVVVSFTVRHVIPANWLNDRDQFLYPNNQWEEDLEFQLDCLTYTLFKNNIQSNHGINHWIPFTEQEVDAKERFESNFMTEFLKDPFSRSRDLKQQRSLFESPPAPLERESFFKEYLSLEAKEVFETGKKLWTYYHHQTNINVNASLYEIREYFQGRNTKGKMNNQSSDQKYTELINQLREDLKILAKKIEPKVYQYHFLKED